MAREKSGNVTETSSKTHGKEERRKEQSVSLRKQEIRSEKKKIFGIIHYQLNPLLFSKLTDQLFSPVFNPGPGGPLPCMF